ncbi:unnamed protein product [Adineta ricciae]|uniref:Uncharacterized protein n=1 Tax=Adineta ricciae TaxID=249248 RepID=A0A815PE86_ADIRI|nr:unnamed protein product [Adineta ricciae]CAF1447678.1 unnamed protein product [Adineta ricciae]
MKRQKEGDDTCEQEHRVVNVRNQYFNSAVQGSDQKQQYRNSTTSPSKPNQTNAGTPKATFPPFRINFISDSCPSELSIIKDMNKLFRMDRSYGRYLSNGNKKCFLLYAGTTEQFDRLMDKTTWPIQIYSCDYEIFLPMKMPMAYSVVAVNVGQFESDIEKQYPTIIEVERLYVKRGIPISKVTIDFASNQEVSKIIQTKRLLLDDENTSFMIQPYSPPTKILRCFNCQQYNDHIAANRPHKDEPKCFRCANCGQNHMAGSPNFLQVKPTETQNPWFNDVNEQHIQAPTYTASQFEGTSAHRALLSDMNSKLNQIITGIEKLSQEKAKSNSNIANAFAQIKACQNDIDTIKVFTLNMISPFLINLGDAVSELGEKEQKEKFHPKLQQFKQYLNRYKNEIFDLVDSTSPPIITLNGTHHDDVPVKLFSKHFFNYDVPSISGTNPFGGVLIAIHKSIYSQRIAEFNSIPNLIA